ncbi:MAG: Bug family tripartite tricarboxylate transporter substrate binding protein [Hyphomicrobiaceae bacterium]
MKRLLGALVALGLALPTAALAQTRTSKIVVAFPPGGPVDIVARLIADPMAKELGHTVIVENKPGGNTFIAAEMVARGPADGSLIFLTSMTTVVLNPLLHATMPYDPIKDFAPVSLVVSSPTIMVVNANSPYNDVAAFVAGSKASAKPLPFGSAGMGGTTHIALEMLMDASGAKAIHIPFKGAAPAISDLINGQVDAFFGDLPGVIGHIKGGKLKAIAIAAKAQTAVLPGVKTMAEQGLPSVAMENWYGIYVASKTPPDVVAKINKAVHVALATESVRQKLIDSGASVIPSTPEALAKAQADDLARYSVIIKAKNIKVE